MKIKDLINSLFKFRCFTDYKNIDNIILNVAFDIIVNQFFGFVENNL